MDTMWCNLLPVSPALSILIGFDESQCLRTPRKRDHIRVGVATDHAWTQASAPSPSRTDEVLDRKIAKFFVRLC
jgi:hypothetical protein